MSHTALVRAAACNNAEWCAAVCRSHGIGSRFTEDAWICDGSPPPFYPSLVSLDDDPVRLTQAILAHRRSAGDGWAVKDSFGELDAGATREKLFDAVWYARPPGPCSAASGKTAQVTSAAELVRWAAAWGETPANAPIFVPRILAEPGVAFWHDGEHRAGLVAYRSGGGSNMVGISNMFGDGEARDGCIASLNERYPGCTAAGYGPEDEAASLARLGFRAIGPLAVWLIGH